MGVLKPAGEPPVSSSRTAMRRDEAAEAMIGAMVRQSLGSRPWTPEELRQLRELAAAGFPINVIARKLKRTSSAVRNKARKEGIARAESRDE